MEKLERDGKVAIVYSPGFGAGWSTWNIEHAEFLCMDKSIAEAVERGDNAEAARLAEFRCEDIYTGGSEDLRIAWIEKGQQFEINEYDGNESVCVVSQKTYLTA